MSKIGLYKKKRHYREDQQSSSHFSDDWLLQCGLLNPFEYLHTITRTQTSFSLFLEHDCHILWSSTSQVFIVVIWKSYYKPSLRSHGLRDIENSQCPFLAWWRTASLGHSECAVGWLQNSSISIAHLFLPNMLVFYLSKPWWLDNLCTSSSYFQIFLIPCCHSLRI